MAGNIIAGAKSYTSAIKKFPYMYSLYIQALANIKKFKYSQFGEETLVREIVGETAGNYGTAWSSDAADMGVWTAHKALFDREIAFTVDAVEEMNSILSGMTLTGVEIMKASWKRLGPEVDAVTCARVSYNIPAGNKFSNLTPGYKTGVEDIIQTLINLRQKAYDAGVWGDIAVMIDSETFGNLTTAFVKNYGLASGVMLSKVKTHLATAVADYNEDNLEFTGSVSKFMDNMYLYSVPSVSMVSQVLLLDKKSAGQKQGGWIADVTNDDFYRVKIQVIPEEAAALSTRHVVGNISVPIRFQSETGSATKTELEQINAMYDGVDTIENIGITQNGDYFWYQNRVKYGVAIFETQRQTMFEVYDGSASTLSVTSVTPAINVIGAEGGYVTVTVGGANLINNMGLQLFNGGTAVGDPVATYGSATSQVGTIKVPANATTADITYTIKATADGTNYETVTGSIVSKTATPAYTSVTNSPDTLTAAGGSTTATVAGTTLNNGLVIGIFKDSETTPTANIVTSGTATAQTASYTLPANATGTDIVWTFKLSTNGGATYSSTLKDTVTVAHA